MFGAPQIVFFRWLNQLVATLCRESRTVLPLCFLLPFVISRMPLIAYVDPDAKATPTLAGDADEIRWMGSISESQCSRVSRMKKKENIPASEDSAWTVFLMILKAQCTQWVKQPPLWQHVSINRLRRRPCVPVDGADAGHTFPVAHLLQQQSVSDLPGEHGGVAAFQMQDRLHNSRCGYFGFRAPDHSWSDAPSLVVPDLTISTIFY